MPKTARPTLSDVARRAGVSTTTASYILNGRADQMRISPETSARVKAAVEELHYRPNRLARDLRRRSTATLGLISEGVAAGRYASQMIVGASNEAATRNHLLLIGETQGDSSIRDRLIEEMLERQVDGLLLATVATVTLRTPALFLRRPAVLLNCVDAAQGLRSVIPDDVDGGHTAARAVIEAGRSARTFVIGVDDNPLALAGPSRLTGITEAFTAAGVSLAGVVHCPWADVPAAHTAISDWFDRDHPEPTALICMNDRIGMAAYQVLEERGLRVPHDVAVVGFDGSDLARWLRPVLSSVALPYARLGELAVRRLLDPDDEGDLVTSVPLHLTDGGSLPC